MTLASNNPLADGVAWTIGDAFRTLGPHAAGILFRCLVAANSYAVSG